MGRGTWSVALRGTTGEAPSFGPPGWCDSPVGELSLESQPTLGQLFWGSNVSMCLTCWVGFGTTSNI